MPASLFGVGDHRDRHVFSELLLVFPKDRSMLGSIEVQFEDNTVGRVGLGALLSGQNGAQRPDTRAMADLDRMIQTLEEPGVELPSFGKIYEYHARFWHFRLLTCPNPGLVRKRHLGHFAL